MSQRLKSFSTFLLISLLILAMISACGQDRPRVVTNIGENEQVATSEAGGAVEPGRTALRDSDKKEVEGLGGVKESDVKDSPEQKSPEKQDISKNSATPQNKEQPSDKKIEEGSTDKKSESLAKKDSQPETAMYKGYKGPVQGEVKYKEGTHASENSREYKATGDIESPYKVDLIVTRDFGHKKIFAKNVGLVRDEVGMEVMFRNLDIQTAYGGGFVNAINGLESHYTFYTGKDRKKLDWFYWVNGILAPVGVAEYRPQPGDVIWWDYHDWSVTMFIPAIIGSYPQPFKGGYGGKNPGTVIMYTEGCKEDAEKLKKSLEDKGVKQVDIAEFDASVIQAPKKYYILLGKWDSLVQGNDYLKDINTKNKLVGVYAKFEDGKLQALNFKGKAVSSHDKAGAIYAYGATIGSLNPIWLVTGTDDKGYKMAFDTILNHPESISGCFGAVITENGVIHIPYGE